MEKARALTGLTETAAVVRAPLPALVERASVRRLARFGGSEPELTPPPRRQLAAG